MASWSTSLAAKMLRTIAEDPHELTDWIRYIADTNRRTSGLQDTVLVLGQATVQLALNHLPDCSITKWRQMPPGGRIPFPPQLRELVAAIDEPDFIRLADIVTQCRSVGFRTGIRSPELARGDIY